MPPSTTKPIKGIVSRVAAGVGNRNQWFVFADQERADYRGTIWFYGGKWNAQFSQTYGRKTSRVPSPPVERFDSAHLAIGYLLKLRVSAGQVAEFDMALV